MITTRLVFCSSDSVILILFYVVSDVMTSLPTNESELQLYRVLQRANLLKYYDSFISHGELQPNINSCTYIVVNPNQYWKKSMLADDAWDKENVAITSTIVECKYYSLQVWFEFSFVGF